MVRVGNADVGGGPRGDVGDHIVVDVTVVGVQPHGHRDVGVQLLEILDGLFVDVGLGLVGIVLGPEHHLILAGGIEGFRHGKSRLFPAAMAAGKRQRPHKQGGRAQRCKLFHPLMPPRDAPSMILLRNARNSATSGTEMTTTAAIMAGMFSRPKPSSRICWMPLETRK